MPDTNLLISAGLFPSSQLSYTLMNIADAHTLVISTRIIDELQRVIALKFPQKKTVLDQFLYKLSYEVAYTPSEIDKSLYPAIRDEKDYPILASAIIADVDIFITGDKDFSTVNTERPEILTIKYFENMNL
jgi:putative PIN family toxin of toxin-antitoxin system